MAQPRPTSPDPAPAGADAPAAPAPAADAPAPAPTAVPTAATPVYVLGWVDLGDGRHGFGLIPLPPRA